MRAETDLVAAASACPDDVLPTNGFDPTDVMVRIFPA
jgi:aminomethyltransferase